MTASLNGVRAVLFDFGGTLDSDGLNWKERFYPLYCEAGIQWSFKEFEKYFHAADDRLTERRLKCRTFLGTLLVQIRDVLKNGKTYTRPLNEKIARSFYDQSIRTIERNKKVLTKLRREYRLGIVSNFYGNLSSVCKDAGLSELFDVIVDSRVVGYTKPCPQIFRAALDRLKFPPGKVLFVGDSVSRDMRGAKAMGMTHLLLAPSVKKGNRLKSCCPGDRIIHSFLELKGMLL